MTATMSQSFVCVKCLRFSSECSAEDRLVCKTCCESKEGRKTRRSVQRACSTGQALADVARMAMDAGLDDATVTKLAIALSHGDHPATLPYLDADLVRRVVERLGL